MNLKTSGEILNKLMLTKYRASDETTRGLANIAE
jgi:hypothetical protein